MSDLRNTNARPGSQAIATHKGDSQDGSDEAGREPFAQIPEWLIYSNVSDRAVRLYGVLVRHENAKTGRCDPGRKRLAMSLACSTKTLDRAVKELEDVGALEVNRRPKTGDGDYESNEYRLRRARPEGVGTRVSPPQGGRATGDATVGPPVAPKREELNDKYPPGGSADAEPRLSAKNLVTFFCSEVKRLTDGRLPPPSVIGHVAREVASLVDEGYDDRTLRSALIMLAESGMHPSSLPTLVLRAQPSGVEQVASPSSDEAVAPDTLGQLRHMTSRYGGVIKEAA